MSVLNQGVWTANEKLDHIDSIPTQITPENGRYHLYISLACPYAHRANLVVKYLGLTGISVSSVSPYKFDPWAFDENYPDPLFGVKNLYDIYLKHQADFSGRATVPVLWDKQAQQIASNTSFDLALDLAENWNALATHKHELVPATERAEIIELNQWISDHINGKIYRVGYASEQANYDKLVAELFSDFAELDSRLANNRYLFGEEIRLSDFFLFPTLIRFEAVYSTLFKCSAKPLSDFPNLYRYMLDLYRIESIRETVDVAYTHTNYFYSFPQLNPSRVVPKLAKLEWQ